MAQQTIAAASAAGTTSVQSYTGEGTFRGFSCRETASSTARVEFRDGTTDTGALLFTVTLVAGESRSEGPWTVGIRFRTGLRIVKPSGTTEVVPLVS